MQNSEVVLKTPSNLTEFFAEWGKMPCADMRAETFAGDALELVRQSGHRLELPPEHISLDAIPELKKITRTERYLEIGSKAALRDILRLGGRSTPDILRQVLEGSASPFLQPLISIGSCVFPYSRSSEITAALSLLDARYELRTSPAAGRWVSAAHYAASHYAAAQGKDRASLEGADARELLTRIRVPLDEWNYSIYRKLRQIDDSGGGSMTVILLAKMHKDILSEIRAAIAGDAVYRERGAESYLAGKRLPLDNRDAERFTALWRSYLDETPLEDDMQKDIAVRCIESLITHFID